MLLPLSRVHVRSRVDLKRRKMSVTTGGLAPPQGSGSVDYHRIIFIPAACEPFFCRASVVTAHLTVYDRRSPRRGPLSPLVEVCSGGRDTRYRPRATPGLRHRLAALSEPVSCLHHHFHHSTPSYTEISVHSCSRDRRAEGMKRSTL